MDAPAKLKVSQFVILCIGIYTIMIIRMIKHIRETRTVA